ncbi:hypothetical protein U1Q18_015791 [Sarracenia purpurea var. burkii]
MEESRPAYWSYSPDQRFVPVKVITPHNRDHIKPVYNPNPVHRVPEPPRSARPIAATVSSSSSSSHASPSWRPGDREMKRKKRVATYKAYAIEGKMKASLRNSFRWVKDKFTAIVHGY